MEIWKDIINYEGHYKINNLGKIISLSRGGKPDYELNYYKAFNGYYTVSLSKNDKHKNVYIHRLLAKAFINNPENKPCINHIDGNKINNDLSNLEWCTYSENNKHAFAIGLKQRPAMSYAGASHPKSRKVIQIFQSGERKSWDSMSIAQRETKIHPSNISAVCRGKKNLAGGFKWEYA